MSALEPLLDRLLVRPDPPEEEVGGVYLPQLAVEKPLRGEVIAAGPGRVTEAGDRVPLSVVVGDRVLYSKYGGTEVEHEGEALLLLRETDLLARVTHD